MSDESIASLAASPAPPVPLSPEPNGNTVAGTAGGTTEILGVEFRAHMRRANTLVAERRLADAQLEIERALRFAPRELRALKLLALVRFRQGQLDQAAEAYRQVTEAAPADSAARLNLGLIALKLERYEEAAEELETAVRLRPEDARAQSYLDHALDQLQRRQDEQRKQQQGKDEQKQRPVAADGPGEGEGEAEPPPSAAEASVEDVAGEDPGATARALAARETTARDAAGVPDAAAPRQRLTDFALERLLVPEELPAGTPWATAEVLRLPVLAEAWAHTGSLLSVEGPLTVALARGRRRGRESGEPLTSEGRPFYRCRGTGELWLAPARPGGNLALLELEEDVLFLRRALVAAFTGSLVWDAGAVAGTGLDVLHFHGSGQLVVDWHGVDVIALRLSEGRRLVVVESRVLGWIGRIVAQASPLVPAGPGTTLAAGASALVACEGEGVLLIARHGHAVEPVHQRAESGDDGAGHPDPLRAPVHR